MPRFARESKRVSAFSCFLPINVLITFVLSALFATASAAPPPPGSISAPATAVPGESYRIEWSPVEGATVYELIGETNGVLLGTRETFAYRSNVAGTYYYKVSACDSSGCSSDDNKYSPKTSGTRVEMPTPGVPSSFSVAPSVIRRGDTITLSWSAPSSNLVSGYKYRLFGTSPDGSQAGIERHLEDFTSSQLSNSRTISYEGTYNYKLQVCNPGNVCGSKRSLNFDSHPLAPGKPGTLSANSLMKVNTSYSVSWGAASGTISHYEVYSNGAYLSSANQTNANVSFATSGNKALSVKACNSGGCGQANDIVNITVYNQPSAVSNVTIVPKQNVEVDDAVTLSWNEPADKIELTYYKIYALHTDLDGDQSFIKIPDEVTGNSIVRHPSLLGTYEYGVQACNQGVSCAVWDNLKSDTDSVVVNKPPMGTIALSSNVDEIPVGGEYTLTWPQASGEVSLYQLYENGDPLGYYTDFSKVFTQSSPGTYIYKIRACYKAGVCADWSQDLSVIVYGHPSPVSNVSVSPKQDVEVYTDITLSWQAPADANSKTYYKVYALRTKLSDGSQSFVAADGTLEQTSSLRTPTEVATYEYGVQACNTGVECVPWQALSGDTDSVVVNAPMLSKVALSSDKDTVAVGESFTLSWPAADGRVNSYQLYENGDPLLFIDRTSNLSELMNKSTAGAYKYKIRACLVEGICGEFSDELVVNVQRTPQNLQADKIHVGFHETVTISWEAPEGVAPAEVYYKVFVDTPYNRGIFEERETHYPDTSRSNVMDVRQGQYIYRVQVCFTDGDTCEGYQDVSVYLFNGLRMYDLQGLEIQSVNVDEVFRLKWNEADDAQCTVYYDDKQASGSQGDIQLSYQVAGTQTYRLLCDFTSGDIPQLDLQKDFSVKLAVNLEGTAGDDTLLGTSGADNIDALAGNDSITGKEGDDTLIGGSGSDTYYYNLHDGSDVITDSSGADTLVFGPGITKENIDMWAEGVDGDLLIKLPDDAVITIKDWYVGGYNGPIVETFVFSDGSSLSRNSLYTTMEVRGSDGDDVWRFPNNTYMHLSHRGGKGDDVITGGNHNDYYYYRLGDGNDIIEDAKSHNRLYLEALNASDVDVFQVGEDIVYLVKPTGHTITIRNWLATTSNRMYETTYADKVERYGTVVGRAVLLASEQLNFLGQNGILESVFIGQPFKGFWSVTDAVSCEDPADPGKQYSGTGNKEFTAYQLGDVQFSMQCTLTDSTIVNITGTVTVTKLPPPQQLKSVAIK